MTLDKLEEGDCRTYNVDPISINLSRATMMATMFVGICYWTFTVEERTTQRRKVLYFISKTQP